MVFYHCQQLIELANVIIILQVVVADIIDQSADVLLCPKLRVAERYTLSGDVISILHAKSPSLIYSNKILRHSISYGMFFIKVTLMFNDKSSTS